MARRKLRRNPYPYLRRQLFEYQHPVAVKCRRYQAGTTAPALNRSGLPLQATAPGTATSNGHRHRYRYPPPSRPHRTIPAPGKPNHYGYLKFLRLKP